MRAAEELKEALREEPTLVRWLESRGYVPRTPAPPVPTKRSLSSARHFAPKANGRAPYVLVLYDATWSSRRLLGSDLRVRQRDANEYRTTLRAGGMENDAPALAIVACPEFLCAFALDGDPFGRRVRFTADALATPGTPLEQVFERFRASTFETWARDEQPANHSLAGLLFGDAGARIFWDFNELFAGGRPDDGFAAFLHAERGRLLDLLIDKKLRDALLEPIWRKIQKTYAEKASERLPSLVTIARDRKLRAALVATADTVLLRVVLYRYLEAQFGHRMDTEEQREIALGSYDDVLQRTVKVDREKLAALRAGRLPKAKQLNLFAHVEEPKLFEEELRARADWYQREAGGDLHHGVVAEAADVLQSWLFGEQGRDLFAELIAGTATDEYSFHYADLDPRAFQEFYEKTIGTDLHVNYDPTTEKRSVVVRDFERNRKERGAYYTDERLCRWLVERSLGRLYDRWEEQFDELVTRSTRGGQTRLGPVKKHLDRLLGLRIIDPTCGGGIFLRAAFDFLAEKRDRIVRHVQRLTEDEREALQREARYRVVTDRAELGEWEWHVLLNVLYGVDVDVKALNVASNLLTLSALTYKRHGVCFPSFLHTSLKPGNALVTPLRPEDRGAFAKAWGDKLASLLDLRRRLRDPSLRRDLWMETHRVAREITLEITRAEAAKAFKDVFGDVSEPELQSRVERVGLFLYEAEFPEVFFEPAGKNAVREREDAGFDVVIGNPPWEEPAAEYKHFLPEFDDEYRSLKGAESLAREKELLADPEIRSRFEDFSAAVEDYKSLLSSGWYRHQARAVRGRKPGAHRNLYKYATEMAWELLHEGGRAGLVLDGGLWSDLAASGLRCLLLDRGNDIAVCGFNNNKGLFEDVHRSYKFSATSFGKGGSAKTLHTVFMQDDFDALERFETIAIELPIDAIRNDPRDSYPVPEVRSAEHYSAERALSAQPSLDTAPWNIDTYSRELNAGEQRSYFVAKAPGRLPLLQGRQFNLFGVNRGKLPESWVDPSDAGAGGFLRGKQIGRVLTAIADWLVEHRGVREPDKVTAAREWIRAVTGSIDVPPQWVRLDWEGFRLAWRTEARNDDRRTLIAGVLPRRVALTHKAPFVRPFRVQVNDNGITIGLQYEHPQLLYLAGVLSSFAADSVARSRLAKKDFNPYLFRELPVPPWREGPIHRRVAELCARLTCLPAAKERPWADYEDLAAAVGLKPARDGLVDERERTEAEVELNALAAELYGLGTTEFRFLMDMLFMTPAHKATHAALRDAIAGRMEQRGGDAGSAANGSPRVGNGAQGKGGRQMADPFSEIGDDWSRPWKISRVLEKLGMEVPDRLRRERVAVLLARLKEKQLEATLADGAPLNARPPSIDAKIRLRKARRVLFSKYEVLHQVGESHAGMSQGFQVRDPDGTIYFLKVVPVTGAHADALRRELDTYTKLQRASGDHVLHVFGSERSDDHLGLLTEFADGGTLHDHLAAHGPLGPPEAKAIAQDICAGLRELHDLGIIHRDLKPANVLRASGVWKLGDFGISKNLARLVTQGRTFQGYGTPDFAPPEQLAGAEAHSSADVYAFGKLLAVMLTGGTDVDKIKRLEWQQLARRCTLVAPDARPSLAEVAEQLASL